MNLWYGEETDLHLMNGDIVCFCQCEITIIGSCNVTAFLLWERDGRFFLSLFTRDQPYGEDGPLYPVLVRFDRHSNPVTVVPIRVCVFPLSDEARCPPKLR